MLPPINTHLTSNSTTQLATPAPESATPKTAMPHVAKELTFYVKKALLKKMLTTYFCIQDFERKMTVHELIYQRFFLMQSICAQLKMNFGDKLIYPITHGAYFLDRTYKYLSETLNHLSYALFRAIDDHFSDALVSNYILIKSGIYKNICAKDIKVMVKIMKQFQPWVEEFFETPLDQIIDFSPQKIDPDHNFPTVLLDHMSIDKKLKFFIEQDSSNFFVRKDLDRECINFIHCFENLKTNMKEYIDTFEPTKKTLLKKWFVDDLLPKICVLFNSIKKIAGTATLERVNEIKKYKLEFPDTLDSGDLVSSLKNSRAYTNVLNRYVKKIVQNNERIYPVFDIFKDSVNILLWATTEETKEFVCYFRNSSLPEIREHIKRIYALKVGTQVQVNQEALNLKEKICNVVVSLDKSLLIISTTLAGIVWPVQTSIWRMYSEYLDAKLKIDFTQKPIPDWILQEVAEKSKDTKTDTDKDEGTPSTASDEEDPVENTVQPAPEVNVSQVVLKLDSPSKVQFESISSNLDLLIQTSENKFKTSIFTSANRHFCNAQFVSTLLKAWQPINQHPRLEYFIKMTMTSLLCHLFTEQTLRGVEFLQNAGENSTWKDVSRNPHDTLQIFNNTYIEMDYGKLQTLRNNPLGSVIDRYPFSYKTSRALHLQAVSRNWIEKHSASNEFDFDFNAGKKRNFAKDYAQDALKSSLSICARILNCKPSLHVVIRRLLELVDTASNNKKIFLQNALFHLCVLYGLNELMHDVGDHFKPLVAYGVLFYLFPMIEQVISFYSDEELETYEESVTHDLLALATKYVPNGVLTPKQIEFLEYNRFGSIQTRYPFYVKNGFNEEYKKFLLLLASKLFKGPKDMIVKHVEDGSLTGEQLLKNQRQNEQMAKMIADTLVFQDLFIKMSLGQV
jgi:hypothetical protein